MRDDLPYRPQHQGVEGEELMRALYELGRKKAARDEPAASTKAHASARGLDSVECQRSRVAEWLNGGLAAVPGTLGLDIDDTCH
jgi:hypothetical protein